MKKRLYVANPRVGAVAGPDGGQTKTPWRVLKQALLVLGIVTVAGSSSGCLIVRDDEGHRHWRWHHEDTVVVPVPPPPPH